MKIEVVNRDGHTISIARSFLRYSGLALPFFLNGAMIPPSILMTPIGLIVQLLIFGFGGAIIYLYMFNQRTRQSLHDLIAGTYVVKTTLPIELNLPSIWKGHLYITGAWLLLGIILPVVVTRLATNGRPLADLLRVQKTIMAAENVHMASVSIGQSTGTQGDINYIRIEAIWNGAPPSFEQAEREIASIALRQYPDAINMDLIVVTIVYGYDIGISSAWRSATDQASPREWMSRIRSVGIAGTIERIRLG